jgi:hypothetical protein
MNNMTWLDLYKFLYEQANNTKNFGQFDWQSPVIIHDSNTGDEFICDTYTISDSRGSDRLVLAINMEAIFGENSNGS